MIRLIAIVVVVATLALLVLAERERGAEPGAGASRTAATAARSGTAATPNAHVQHLPPEAISAPSDAAEGVDEEPVPLVTGDAWSAVSPLQGRHALLDPGAAFDAARPGAEAGDPGALLDLAFAVENCHAAANFPTPAAFDAFLRTRPNADPDEVEALAALIPTCRRMAAAAPEGMRLEAWSRSLRSRAAEAGQPLARFLAVDLWPPSQAAYDEAVTALSEAVAEESPFAWREAAEFLLAFPSPVRDDPYRVEASAWLLLGCRADGACDARRLEAQIADAQLPVYAEDITRRTDALRRAIDAGATFDLDTGWQAPEPEPGGQ